MVRYLGAQTSKLGDILGTYFSLLCQYPLLILPSKYILNNASVLHTCCNPRKAGHCHLLPQQHLAHASALTPSGLVLTHGVVFYKCRSNPSLPCS